MLSSITFRSGFQKIFAFIISLIITTANVAGQQTYLDSLLLRVEQLNLSPAELAEEYSNIATAYQHSSAEKVMEYAFKTLSVVKNDNIIAPDAQARALLVLANLKIEAGEQDSAAWYIGELHQLSMQNDDTFLKASIANLKTIQFYRVGKLDSARQSVERGLQLLRETSDTLTKTYLSLLNSKSIVLQFDNQLSEALLVMYQMKDIQKETDEDPLILMALHQNIAYILYYLKDYAATEKELLACLSLAEENNVANIKMRALVTLLRIAHSQDDTLRIYKYHDELIKTNEANQTDPNVQIIVDEAHGQFYKFISDQEKATHHYTRVIELSEEIGLPHYKQHMRIKLASLYLAQGNIIKATSFLNMIEKHEVNNLRLEQKLEYYIAKGELAFQKNELGDAYYNSKQARLFGDTLNQSINDRTAERIFLQERLNEQKIYSQNLESQSDFDKQSLQRSRKFILWLSIIGLTLIVSITALFLGREKLRKAINQLALTKQKLQTSNDQLYDQNEELVQLNHEKDIMLHMVSHDLQSPIGSLQLLNQLMPRFGKLNDKQLEYQSMMQQELDRANELIQNLMLLYLFDKDRQTSHPLSITLPEGLRSTFTKYENIAAKKGIDFNIINEQSSIALITDLGYLASIIDNLLSNAIKFSPPGGKVTFELEETGDGICFAISDNGPGFTEEDQKQMYKRFQKLSARPTANENSTGLGLAITKRMVERLNGNIQLITRPGAGACFQLAIPNQQVVT